VGGQRRGIFGFYFFGGRGVMVKWIISNYIRELGIKLELIACSSSLVSVKNVSRKKKN